MPAVAGAAFTMAAMLLLCVGCSSESDRAATASPGAGGSKSASHAETIAADYVEAFRDHAELSEQVACLENRAALASGSDVSLDVVPGYHGVPSEPQQAMVAAFDAAGAQFVEGLIDCTRRQGAETEQLVTQWKSFRAQRNSAEIQLAEVEATKHVAGQLATILSLDNRLFWLAAFIAFLALAVVALHERRHAIRRLTCGARARALGASIVLPVLTLLTLATTVVIFGAGHRIYAWLVESGTGSGYRTMTVMAEEVQELRKANEDLTPRAQALREQLAPPVAQALASLTAASEVAQIPVWAQAQARLFTAAVHAGVQQQIAAGLAADLQQFESLSQEYAKSSAAVGRSQFWKWFMQLLLGLAFLAAVTTSGWLLLRGCRRRQQVIADTCPMCLGVGKFQVAGNPGSSRRGSVSTVRCKNVVSANRNEDCRFEFLSVYRDMPKLCFPTLGHSFSGKTHWLAMLYRELNRGNYHANVQFEKVKSTSSEEFDRTVNDILNAKIGTRATQTAHLPFPLVFNFCDDDRFGRSNVLVNIFDYSGEVTRSFTLDHPHRRRALDGDGYLFFLDPTAPAEAQAVELVDFREDVRAIRGVRTGQAIRSPVALCVSKIDLLTTQPYASSGGAGPVDAFYKALRDVDPTGSEFSLRAIRARSQLVADLRDTIWPGWQIERQIHDLFGGRYMFFPLTPVGLTEIGETDLTLRTIDPFAILEPLAWLLHMNGYPVLK